MNNDYKEIKSKTVANKQLYDEVAIKCDISPKQVEEIITFVGKFIANTIKEGSMSTVMIPRFGKFMVNQKKLQWMNHKQTVPIINTSE